MKIRTYFAYVLLLAVAFAPLTMARAQAPALVVSIANIDRLLDDITYVSRAAKVPEVGGLITLMTSSYTEKFDTRKPLGVIVTAGEGEPTGVVVLPIKDLDGLLESVRGQIPPLKEEGGGIQSMNLQRPVYLRDTGDWVFISNSKAALVTIPEDPTRQLKQLNDKYEIGFQLNVQNVPEELRERAISEMKSGFQEGARERLEAGDEISRENLDEFVALIEESDQITVGLGIDRNEGSIFLDLGLTALNGTALSKQFDALSNARSDFSGFLLPEAAAALQFSTPLTEEDISRTTVMFKVLREELLKEFDNEWANDSLAGVVRDAVTSMLSLIDDTIQAGKLDGGAAMVLDSGQVQFVAGGFVADGRVVENVLKHFHGAVLEAGDVAAVPDVKFNVGKHQDVDLHQITIPLPEGEEQARKMLGDELILVVGTGQKSVFLGVGTDSMQLLKSVIEESARNAGDRVPPFNLRLSLARILGFASEAEGDPGLKVLAEALQDAEGEDHVSVTAKAVPNGVSYRLLVEEGILQLIGRASNLGGSP